MHKYFPNLVKRKKKLKKSAIHLPRHHTNQYASKQASQRTNVQANESEMIYLKRKNYIFTLTAEQHFITLLIHVNLFFSSCVDTYAP